MYEHTLMNMRRANRSGRGIGSRRDDRSWMPPGVQCPAQETAALHWRERGHSNRWRPAEAAEGRWS